MLANRFRTTGRFFAALLLTLGLLGVLFLTIFPVQDLLHALAAPAGGPDVRLIAADDTGITLELSLPAAWVPTDPGFGTTLTGDPGRPQLPYFTALVGVPGGVEIRLGVDASAPKVLAKGIAHFPLAQTPAPLDQDLSAGQWRTADLSGTRQADTLYPETLARLGDDAWMREQRMVRVEFFPVQVDTARNQTVGHDRIRVRLDFVGAVNRHALAPASGRTDPFETMLASTLINYAQAQTWRGGAPVQAVPGSPARQAQADTPLLKIVVDQDGLYRLTPADLTGAGFNLTGVDPAHLALTNRGQPVAIHISGQDDGTFDPGDAIYFYGQRFVGNVDRDAGGSFYACPQCAPSDVRMQVMENTYTDDNVYWLSAGSGPGLRMAELAQTPGSWPTPVSFPETVWAEESTQWFTHHWTDKDTWFWGRVRSTVLKVGSGKYTTLLPTPASAKVPYSATVTARLVSKADRLGHHTIFGLNNRVVLDDAVWNGRTAYTFTAQVDSSALISGVNTLAFTTTNDVVAEIDDLYFDWFKVSYPRQFVAQADSLTFGLGQAGTFAYQIANFSAADVAALEITDPLLPRWVTGVQASSGGSGVMASLQLSHTAEARFVVAASPALRTPKALISVQPTALRSPANGADYIIISHSAFITDVQRLADYRAAQGLRVKVVDVADLYNEFNDGIYSPVAIRNFLAYAYANWQAPAPQYVLLVGDGHWNFKNYGSYGADPIYMPPMLARVDPWQGEVDATNLLAAIVGDDIMPDLMIGRFPVNNGDELTAMIDKTIGYENNQDPGPAPGRWQRTIAFVTDNTPDAAGEFVESAEHFFQTYVTGDFQPIRLYADDYVGNPAAVTQALSKTLNVTGTLLLNYVGHGFIQGWAAENLWLTTDVPSLTNADRLPIMLSMDCLDGYWIYPGDPSLAEVMARYAGGGSVAAFSPTGLGVAVGHDDLFEGFYDYLFVDQGRILGQAAQAAKLRLFSQKNHADLINTFMLNGDPALRLPMPAQPHAEVYLPAVQRPRPVRRRRLRSDADWLTLHTTLRNRPLRQPPTPINQSTNQPIN